jgi:hypothetical protein
MTLSQIDYVLQYTQEIEKLLREAGSGNLDKDVDKLIKTIKEKHALLNDINKNYRWADRKYEMGLAARKLKEIIPEQKKEISKALEFIKKHRGSPLRKAMLDRVLTKLIFVRTNLGRSIANLSRMNLPSAGFQNRELTPGVFEHYFTLYHPGSSASAAPSAAFRFTGPAGSEVTIEMEHVRGLTYGGHGHDIAAEHLGSFECVNAEKFEVLSPGKVRLTLRDESETTVQFLASDVCTRRKMTVTQLWPGTGLRHVMFVDVRYAQRLHDLNDYNLKYMHLYTGDDYHPDNVCHYGSKEMIAALEKLNHAFGRALESGEFDDARTDIGDDNSLSVTYSRPKQPMLWINDLSLPWGGLFRSYADWTGQQGHNTHRWGNCVDISINPKNNISDKQIAWMKRECPKIFGVDYYRGKGHKTHLHFEIN